MSRYPLFDRRQIALKDLRERGHDLQAADCKPLSAGFKNTRIRNSPTWSGTWSMPAGGSGRSC